MSADTEDPLGGPFWRDALWEVRFWRRRRWPIEWRHPGMRQDMPWAYDPRFELYAEFVEWVAEPETPRGKERWVVMSRPWHGWPDPPEFAFFAQDLAGEVICAGDFDWWPKAWVRPGKTLDELISEKVDELESKPGDETLGH